MKMKLRLEDLHVDSFAASPELQGRGTMKGLMYEAGSGVHSQCYTHCASGCEGSCTCPSEAATHCAGDSCDDACDPVTVTVDTIATFEA